MTYNMTSIAKRYNIDDYSNIIFDNTYVLPNEVTTIIQELATILNISTTSIIVPEKTHRKDRNKDRNKEHTQESWDTLRSFKSTVIEKKEGIEKIISDVRICLNKMSTKNYEKNRDTIIQYINDNQSHIKDIAQAIFDIASTNKFFSELYAELYKELIQYFNEFQIILNDFILNYVDTMTQIEYANPTDNYDKFCIYNKKNDARKASSTFIVNLVKKNVIDVNVLISIICQIEVILCDSIEQVNKINEVEEIVENLYLLITDSMSYIKKSDIDVFASIKQISQYKPKDKTSISTRAIFKCMDIIDMKMK